MRMAGLNGGKRARKDSRNKRSSHLSRLNPRIHQHGDPPKAQTDPLPAPSLGDPVASPLTDFGDSTKLHFDDSTKFCLTIGATFPGLLG